MPCYHPVRAFRDASGGVVFVERGNIVANLWLPCGQCVGCRLERSRQWAIRCVHEASLHKRNCFITLTYSPAFCPEDYSLKYADFQLFMRYLRRRLGKVRFYMCGEYGEDMARPHFHACLFGVDFEDKLYFKKSGEIVLYTSALLSKLWGKGFATVGDVTFETAAYCARYVMKKVNGDLAASRYEAVLSSGEIVSRTPEFCHMSLKPGIGKGWLDKFSSDVYPNGMVVTGKVETRPPSYYDKWFKVNYPEQWEAMAWQRELYARDRAADSTPERLSVREAITKARISQLHRPML